MAHADANAELSSDEDGYCSDKDAAVAHTVVARKMWRRGEVRFEDQWGRRLVPVNVNGDVDGSGGVGFRFEIWPVEEDVVNEGPDAPGF